MTELRSTVNSEIAKTLGVTCSIPKQCLQSAYIASHFSRSDLDIVVFYEGLRRRELRQSPDQYVFTSPYSQLRALMTSIRSAEHKLWSSLGFIAIHIQRSRKRHFTANRGFRFSQPLFWNPLVIATVTASSSRFLILVTGPVYVRFALTT
jgi:hypothetical protein